MRWIAALSAFLLITAALTYHFVVRDRNFDSYAGIELGMPFHTAVTHLEDHGYLVIHSASKERDQDCNPKGHVLIYARRPDYYLHITPNRECKLGKITRRLGKIEL